MAYTPTQFAAALDAAVARAPRETEQVVKKGALNVKTEGRANVLQTAPVHNAGAHNTITFEEPHAVGGRVESEIGYDRRQGPEAALGNLLEYGGGGDHSPPHLDLTRALRSEDARFVGAIGDMGEGLIQ